MRAVIAMESLPPSIRDSNDISNDDNVAAGERPKGRASFVECMKHTPHVKEEDKMEVGDEAEDQAKVCFVS